MDRFERDSNNTSLGDSSDPRFTSQAATVEDLLKSQTVGLVNLNDYRKRRAEALDLKERGLSASVTPDAGTPTEEYDA